MVRLLRWTTVLVTAMLAATPASAQEPSVRAPTTFFLPLDVTQGAITNAPGVTPYIAALKLQAALGVGQGAPFRAGPVVAVRYANPEWTVAGGARAQWLPMRFGLGGRRWGFGVIAEQLWDSGGNRPSALGVIADLELFRAGASLVHDWSDESTGFELSFGTDLRSVHAVLFPQRDPDPFGGIP